MLGTCLLAVNCISSYFQLQTHTVEIIPKIDIYLPSLQLIHNTSQNLETDGTEWAREVLKVLMKMSPTSMAVTHKQLKLGSQLPLEECLQMELR